MSDELFTPGRVAREGCLGKSEDLSSGAAKGESACCEAGERNFLVPLMTRGKSPNSRLANGRGTSGRRRHRRHPYWAMGEFLFHSRGTVHADCSRTSSR